MCVHARVAFVRACVRACACVCSLTVLVRAGAAAGLGLADGGGERERVGGGGGARDDVHGPLAVRPDARDEVHCWIHRRGRCIHRRRDCRDHRGCRSWMRHEGNALHAQKQGETLVLEGAVSEDDIIKTMLLRVRAKSYAHCSS
jgi:hypothetical protein